MKVVLFSGGLGLRMKSSEHSAPKPMMTIGNRSVLWHIMRYYAHFGHTELILALGHGATAVKEFFLNYDETASNDFVLRKGGAEIVPLTTDISDWTITFVDTGLETSIGERLRRVRPHLEDGEVFFANHGDVLTDAPLDRVLQNVLSTDAVGSLPAVKPQDSFHVVEVDDKNRVRAFTPVAGTGMRINGGYFVLRQSIFDYFDEGEDLVTHAAARAAAAGRFLAIPYDGFWAPMDTLKERAALEDNVHRRGACPWILRRAQGPHPGGSSLDIPQLLQARSS